MHTLFSTETVTKAILATALWSSGVTAADLGDTVRSIDDLRWQNRIILIRSDHSIKAIEESLLNAEAKLNDRDTFWFILSDNTVTTNFESRVDSDFFTRTQQRYFTPANDPVAVRLIGKDGGVKYSGTELDLDTLFNTIDAMPMRQAEIQSKLER